MTCQQSVTFKPLRRMSLCWVSWRPFWHQNGGASSANKTLHCMLFLLH